MGVNFSRFNGFVLSVVGDVPACIVSVCIILCNYKKNHIVRSFKAHRGRVYVRAFIGVSALALLVSVLCCVTLKKMPNS